MLRVAADHNNMMVSQQRAYAESMMSQNIRIIKGALHAAMVTIRMPNLCRDWLKLHAELGP